MIDDQDSLIAPTKRSPVKAIAALVAIAAAAAAAWWMFGDNKGQPENPARVLIVGPTPELADFLEREGFDVDQLSVGAAVGEGQAFDASLDEISAILEYADQSGFGYVALNMAHGEQYDFSTISDELEAEAPPAGTTFAVVSVGDLGHALTYGGVVPEVVHDKPAGEQVGLLLALFDHEHIARARTREANNDLMIRFGSAGTVEDVVEYEKGQQNMRRQIAAWTALSERERGEPKPSELALPYEKLRGWPLANGALLLASGRGAWRSDNGRDTSWEGDDLDAELSVITLDSGDLELNPRQPCDALPETLSLDDGFAVAPAGDALLIPSGRWVADLWVLSGQGCSFEKRDQIRRLDGGELGIPRASGRTATALNGRLMWADAKMRAYRQARIDGVGLRHDELRWASEDTVVMPAGLDFAAAAVARARRRSTTLDPDGAREPPPPPDPSALPDNREALIFVELPPPKQDDDLQVAVVPVDLLMPDASAPSTLAIRDAFPLPATSTPGLSVVALIDSPDGSRLVRVALASDADIWRNALATDYDLSSAIESPAGAVEIVLLAGDLPHEAHDLAISPTGSHAAWAAPFGEAPSDRPLANFEIVLLPLGLDGATPVRLTDNDRSDLRPRFAGVDGGVLVFDSAYAASDGLRSIEALRLVPIQR